MRGHNAPFQLRNETLFGLKNLLFFFNFNPYFSKAKLPEEVSMLMEQESWMKVGPSGNLCIVPQKVIYIRRKDLSLLCFTDIDWK